MTEITDEEIIEMAENNERVQAIKKFWGDTDASLKEAKNYVDDLVAGRDPDRPSETRNTSSSKITDKEIRELLDKGHKIKAIKEFREDYDVNLKEAKSYVDKIQNQGTDEEIPIKITRCPHCDEHVESHELVEERITREELGEEKKEEEVGLDDFADGLFNDR